MKTISTAIRLLFTERGESELVLSLQTNKYQIQTEYAELKELLTAGKKLRVEITEQKKKRSLDSNSYLWILVTKLANVLRTSKDELYIEMLKKYGQREKELISVVADGTEMIFKALRNHCTVIGEKELNGKLFKHIAILRGSSNYNSLEMTILIDGVVSDCKEQGIETLTPSQIAELNSRWAK